MNIKKELKKAYIYFQQKNLINAEEVLLRIIKKYPAQIEAINNLASIKVALGKPMEAIKFLEKSLKIKLQESTFHNLINLYSLQSNWIKIEEFCESYSDKINYNLEIELLYLTALRENNNNNNNNNKIISKIDSLMSKYKSHINLYLSSIYTLNKLNEFQKALEVGLKGKIIEPDSFYINYNLGITYSNLRQPEKSIYYLREAENLNQDNNLTDLWLTLSAQYMKLNKMGDALNIIKKAKKRNAENIKIILQEASIESHSGNYDIAEHLLKNILQENPHHIEANFMLGVNQLRKKDFKNAFKYYRFRTRRVEAGKFGLFDDFDIPVIDKNSKVLIAWEQGIGDQLFYFRLMSEFSKLVKEITYVTTEKLLTVLQKNYPKINIITENELNLELYDDYIKLNLATILYYLDGANIENNRYNFLSCDEDKKRYFLNKYKSKNKIVGLSWFSSNDNKGFSLSSLENIFKELDYTYVSLQYGDTQKDIDKISKTNNVNIYHEKNLDYFNDIYDLLALISICDEVITCVNITAHLSGLLGVSTRLIIPESRGRTWYWDDAHFTNNHSDWYPSVKLYTPEKNGSWANVLKKIKNEISN